MVHVCTAIRGAGAGLAMTLAAAAAAAGMPATQLAQGAGFHDIARWQLCRHAGYRAPIGIAIREANRAGYHNVHDVRFVARRYGNGRACGFYRMEAVRGRERFILYASAGSGRLIGRQPIFFGPRHRGPNLTKAGALTTLYPYGFRRVRELRYVRAPRGDHYAAEAVKGGWVVHVRISDETGAILSTRRPHQVRSDNRFPELTRREVREALRQDGFRRITNLRYVRRPQQDFYVARAWRDGRPPVVRVSDETGEVTGRRPAI